METEGSPKVLSFRYNINVNTQHSDLIFSNQRNLESAKAPFQKDTNKKIQQLMDGLCSESTDRNNQDSTSNTSCISNLSPLKVKQGQKDIENQFTFVSQDESLNLSGIPKQQHYRSNNRLSVANKSSQRKTSSSSISEKIYEEKYCSLCNQADQYSNFIRPCLCKDRQHLHQQCVQEALQQFYMDEQKIKFIKPIVCEKCKFNFIIKSYKQTDFGKAFQDPLKHSRILLYLLAIVTLILIFCATIIFSILNRQTLEQRVEYIVASIVSGFIILAFLFFIYSMMMDYISVYKWCILDREQAKVNDNGVRMNYETLNQMLEHQRKKEEKKQNTQKKLELIIQ